MARPTAPVHHQRPAAEAPPSVSPPAHQGAALAVVAFAGLLVALTQSLLIPVLPQITADLGASANGSAWLLTSTLLVAAVAVPVVTRLGDLHGKRLMLIVSAALLALGSLICALSDTLAPMIVGRAVTGLSMGAIPLGISLIGVLLPPHKAAGGIALVSATLGVGGALGLPMAGLIGEHSDYHILFWIGAVGGALSLAGALFALKEPPQRAQGTFDLFGAVLLAATLVCLLLPLSQASRWGWSDARTICLLAAAAAGLVLFIGVERRTASPLVDMAVNAKPGLLLTNVASLCVGFALFASFIGTAAYVQAPESTGYGFGSSIVVSGLCMLPSGVAMLMLSPVSATLSQRIGPKKTLAIGSSVVALGFVCRIVLTDHLWEIILGTTIAGAGTGIAYAAMPALIALSAPRDELAAANGLNALFRSVGSSLSSALGATLLASQVIRLGGTELPSLGGYRTLFGVCAVAALVGAAVALTIPRARISVEDAVGAH
jgi:MFS family permease